MFDEHDSIIGEHELVHVCKHDCCTWTVTRPCVPRGAIQARVSHSIPDVFVASLGPQLDFASDVEKHIFGKLSISNLILLSIVLQAFSEGSDICITCCRALVDPESRNVAGCW